MKYFHVNWNPVIYSIGLDIFISSRFTIPPIHTPTPCGYMCADVIDNVWNWRSYRCREQQYMPCINIIFDWSIKKCVNIYCALELMPVCLPYETKFQTLTHAHIHEKTKSKSNGKKPTKFFVVLWLLWCVLYIRLYVEPENRFHSCFCIPTPVISEAQSMKIESWNDVNYEVVDCRYVSMSYECVTYNHIVHTHKAHSRQTIHVVSSC